MHKLALCVALFATTVLLILYALSSIGLVLGFWRFGFLRGLGVMFLILLNLQATQFFFDLYIRMVINTIDPGKTA